MDHGKIFTMTLTFIMSLVWIVNYSNEPMYQGFQDPDAKVLQVIYRIDHVAMAMQGMQGSGHDIFWTVCYYEYPNPNTTERTRWMMYRYNVICDVLVLDLHTICVHVCIFSHILSTLDSRFSLHISQQQHQQHRQQQQQID